MLESQFIKLLKFNFAYGSPFLIIFIVIFLVGCHSRSLEDEGYKNALKTASKEEIFNNHELTRLKKSADLMADIYRNSGVSGMKDNVINCYENPDQDTLACMGGDFFASLIDKEISRINNFPRDDFFQENQVVSRLAQSEIFKDEDIFALFMVASIVKKEITKYAEKMTSAIQKNS
jgi:hypothetical protein